MARHRVTVIPADYAQTRRNNGSECLLAVALNRQYGGQWSVGPGSAERHGSRGRWRLGARARLLVAGFDTGLARQASRRPVTVTLYGPAIQRRAAGYRAFPRGAVAVPAGIVPVLLVADGLAWLLAVLVIVAAGVTGLLIAIGRTGEPRVITRKDPEPARAWPDGPGWQQPSLRERGR